LTQSKSDGSIEEPAKHADAINPALLETLKSCPAFKGGAEGEEDDNESITCPFRTVSELQDIGEVMTKMPSSHTVSGSPANKILLGTLQAVHVTSQAERERLGGRPCPVFDNGCPFKQCRTSDDLPVVLELEARVWFVEPEDAEERRPSLVTAEEEEPETGALPEAKATEETATTESKEEPARDIFLSKLLKMGTQDAHKAAESGTFVKRLLRGKVAPEEYRLFLVDLVHVYEALESSLEEAATVKQCQVVQAIHHPTELTRLGNLQQDLEFWFRSDPGARAAAMPSEAALEYAARIRELVATAPHLLVAHAYTRYLGDLSGGTVIRRSICRAMPVGKDGEGVRFFDFENVPDAKSFKQKYRDELDCLDVPPTVADEIVQEANMAFDLNTRVFRHLDELAGIEAPAEVPRPRVALPAGHPPVKEGADTTCPFAAMAAGGDVDARARKEKKAPAAPTAPAPAPTAAPPASRRRTACTWNSVLGGAVLVVPLALTLGAALSGL
jgi:heme oxygenase